MSRRLVLVCLFLALPATALAGCGVHGLASAPVAARVAAASPVLVAQAGHRYSPDDRDRYAGKVDMLIAYYDRSRDHQIQGAESPCIYKHDAMDSDQRWDGDWILRTRIYFDRYRGLKDGVFDQLDTNHDGAISHDEMVEGYLADRDTNADGALSLWERLKAMVLTPSARFENKWVVETGRSQWYVFQPVPDADARNRIPPPPPPLPANAPVPALHAPPDME